MCSVLRSPSKFSFYVEVHEVFTGSSSIIENQSTYLDYYWLNFVILQSRTNCLTHALSCLSQNFPKKLFILITVKEIRFVFLIICSIRPAKCIQPLLVMDKKYKQKTKHHYNCHIGYLALLMTSIQAASDYP